MVLKHAAILGAPPYNMKASATALVEWVQERQPQYEALDVSYCSLKSVSVARKLFAVPPFSKDEHAVPLEVAPGVISIGAPARPRQPKRISPEAKFVYPMAHNLVKDHELSWENAITTARGCWEMTPANLQTAVSQSEAIDEAGELNGDGQIVADSDVEFDDLEVAAYEL